MAVRESEEIRKSLKPIFLSSWVFGVPRVGCKYIYRIIYSGILSVTYASTFSITFNSRIILVNAFNAAMKMFYISSQFVIFISGIGTILFWVAKGAEALEDAIMELAELDVELKDLGMEIDHGKIFRRQIGLIALFSGLWATFVIMNEYITSLMGVTNKNNIFHAVCLAYSSSGPNLLILSGELVFSIIMYVIYLRFQWINEILRKASEDQEHSQLTRTFRVFPVQRSVGPSLSNRKTISTETLLAKIKRLYKVHQRLCGITEKVSSSFSWQLYLAVSVTFGLLIYRLLILYSLAFLPLEKLGVRIGLNAMWVIYYILKFWMITLTCCATSAEANKLGIMLYGIVINDERYHRMLHEYSVQLSQNKLYFTAGSFFAIDLSLVYTLISHVTTYIFFAVDVWSNAEEKHTESETVASKNGTY